MVNFAGYSMESVQIHDKHFDPFLSAEEIQKQIKRVASEIDDDFSGKPVVFVGVMNGSFRFVSDLIEHIEWPCEVSFIKMASYEGTETTGKVNQLIGFNEPLQGKHLIVLEDIVDTGGTVERIDSELKQQDPASVSFATLLYKPEAYKKEIEIKYVGFEIPNDFIVGYGLDYDGLGRNLNSIYKIQE